MDRNDTIPLGALGAILASLVFVATLASDKWYDWLKDLGGVIGAIVALLIGGGTLLLLRSQNATLARQLDRAEQATQREIADRKLKELQEQSRARRRVDPAARMIFDHVDDLMKCVRLDPNPSAGLLGDLYRVQDLHVKTGALPRFIIDAKRFLDDVEVAYPDLAFDYAALIDAVERYGIALDRVLSGPEDHVMPSVWADALEGKELPPLPLSPRFRLLTRIDWLPYTAKRLKPTLDPLERFLARMGGPPDGPPDEEA